MTTEDLEAIRELLHRYCHYADPADPERGLSRCVSRKLEPQTWARS